MERKKAYAIQGKGTDRFIAAYDGWDAAMTVEGAEIRDLTAFRSFDGCWYLLDDCTGYTVNAAGFRSRKALLAWMASDASNPLKTYLKKCRDGIESQRDAYEGMRAEFDALMEDYLHGSM